jgi:hypothetical protein
MSENEAKEAEARPKRPKMALDEQAAYVLNLIRRCEMHSPDRAAVMAGAAVLTLTADDMLRLETIQQTLSIFEVNKADDLVRQKIWKDAKGRKK